jgi:thiol-disulfide isomerase/thioredoxin
MSLIDASPPTMARTLSSLDRPSLVFFHKQGCSPCAAVMPHVRDVAARFPALDVYLVDVTGGTEGVHAYTNGGTPLVVLFDTRGLEEWRWRGGSVTADRMSTQIEDVLR